MAVEDVYIKLENGKVEMTGNGVDVMIALCGMVAQAENFWKSEEALISERHEHISRMIYRMMQAEAEKDEGAV